MNNVAHGPSLVEIALTYASRGFPVLPCVPNEKRPLTRHGLDDASLDEAAIRQWFEAWPDANIAVRCDNLVVIDIDGPAGQAWAKQENVADLLGRAGAVQRTPKGMHYVFRKPAGFDLGNAVGIVEGVDLRSNRGYIVVAPSRTEAGRYSWAVPLPPHDELPELPSELAEALRRAPQQQQQQQQRKASELPPVIPDGRRNTTLFRFASFLRRSGMTKDEMRAALAAINAARCSPPLPDSRIETIAKSAERYQPDAATVAAIHSDADAELLVRADCVKPEPIRWLVPHLLARSKITLLASRPKLGKSIIACRLAASIARDGGHVLMVATEDDSSDTLIPRLIAANAPLEKIHVVRDGAIPTVQQIVEAAFGLAAQVPLRLIIVDPVNSVLGPKTDGNSDVSVRSALAPLRSFAAASGVAVLLLHHHRKKKPDDLGDVNERILGSTGYFGVARLTWHIEPDETDPTVRWLVQGGSNLASEGRRYPYRIASVTLGQGVNAITAPVIEWLDADIAGATANAAASEWLQQQLASGPRPLREIVRAYVAENGGRVSERTAQDRLSALRDLVGFTTERVNGVYCWRLK